MGLVGKKTSLDSSPTYSHPSWSSADAQVCLTICKKVADWRPLPVTDDHSEGPLIKSPDPSFPRRSLLPFCIQPPPSLQLKYTTKPKNHRQCMKRAQKKMRPLRWGEHERVFWRFCQLQLILSFTDRVHPRAGYNEMECKEEDRQPPHRP